MVRGPEEGAWVLLRGPVWLVSGSLRGYQQLGGCVVALQAGEARAVGFLPALSALAGQLRCAPFQPLPSHSREVPCSGASSPPSSQA